MNNQLPHAAALASSSASSTGPRTEEGKAISCQNARKHDLCSRTLRLSPEEWVEYNDMCERYRLDLNPGDEIQQTLVDEICFNYWRLQQARDVELRIIAEHPADLPMISLYIRYRTGYERAFYKALERIHKIQADVRKRQKASTAPASVCSENSSDDEIRKLECELEDHTLENRVRGELSLPPLELPKKLSARLDQFLSQNPDALPQRLVDRLKKVA